jgi:hypothetical protein
MVIPRRIPRSWKDYFARTPRLPTDFIKRLRDAPPEDVEPISSPKTGPSPSKPGLSSF